MIVCGFPAKYFKFVRFYIFLKIIIKLNDFLGLATVSLYTVVFNFNFNFKHGTISQYIKIYYLQKQPEKVIFQ